ncbi:hypothetical protein LTR70_001865 [Exophiala xenobiotica]|uniref:Uncharacterized protein n=1 Tax=Lithohypha guttulata TaxID=1690604 RepID=A0ABR0K9X7_9EURO|nr:hypothetical protein LTR24_005133 [Lithohypha guttulata]KAK5326851.1 hypothetical protein LTR70_001865 [Exophiala xenobiotica]
MQDDRVPLSYEEFKQQWDGSDETTSDLIVDVAWRRYQHVHAAEFKIVPENDHPSLDQLKEYFELLLNQPGISELCSKRVYLELQASNIPWTPTSIQVKPEQPVTIFATGRTWRSKILDLYLPPHFNLWHRIGVNGSVFNSTHDTKTFNSGNGQSGELFVANQFPGGFHDRGGGRLGGNLSVYDKAEGAFQIVIIQWNEGMTIYEDVKAALVKIWDISHDLTREGTLAEADPYKLLSTARQQLTSDYFARYYPADWSLLWFLGLSEIFFQEQFEESTAMIRCLPNGNVGILQKDLLPTVPLCPTTTTSWSWNIIALPSRLREDTTLSHDYLSLAFEFENGRDLTYTWSWELPVGFGYWCPLAAWCDREYHVVIRSGTQQLGQWLDEQRNIYRDYVEYVNAGDLSKHVPEQIVRVWLIAGNRWQRHRGEMLIKNIALSDEDEGGEVTLVL